MTRDYIAYYVPMFVLILFLGGLYYVAVNIKHDNDLIEECCNSCLDRLRLTENAKEAAIHKISELENDSARLQGQIHALSQQVAALMARQPVKAITTNTPKGVQKIWQQKSD